MIFVFGLMIIVNTEKKYGKEIIRTRRRGRSNRKQTSAVERVNFVSRKKQAQEAKMIWVKIKIFYEF